MREINHDYCTDLQRHSYSSRISGLANDIYKRIFMCALNIIQNGNNYFLQRQGNQVNWLNIIDLTPFWHIYRNNAKPAIIKWCSQYSVRNEPYSFSTWSSSDWFHLYSLQIIPNLYIKWFNTCINRHRLIWFHIYC